MKHLILAQNCPSCEGGELRIRRRHADGHPFIGCSNYPRCSFTSDYNEEVEELLDRMRVEIASLRVKLARKSPGREELISTLKKLIFKLHPDRNSAGIDPTEAVAILNATLSKIKK